MDFGDGTLFRDVGHDLEVAAQATITGAVVGLRTQVARQAIATQEGQTVVAEQNASRFVPLLVIAVAVVVVFLFGRMLLR